MPQRYFNKAKNEIKLEPGEQALMRRELEGFMANHPAHHPTSWFARFSPALATILLVGSSVSLAARGALPGDLLYPIKVGVNEQVQTFFAGSPEARVELEADLAGKRIEEARTLKATGKLDAQTEANISVEANKHIEAAQNTIVELKAVGEIESAAKATQYLEAVVGVEATSSANNSVTLPPSPILSN